MSTTPNAPVQTWVIGRAEDCDLQLPQLEVSSHHARLIRQGDQHWIEDTNSSNGVYINGSRIPANQPVYIPPGALVTLGRQIPLPWPQAAPPPPPAQPHRGGPGNGLGGSSGSAPKPAIPPPLPGSRVITIGRAPGSDKQVDLPIVSWEHARIVYENGQPILEDLGSRNGTSIDRIDNRIQRAPLDVNSVVYLGSYKIAARELLTAQRVTVGEAAFNKVEFRGNSMVIGRDPKADVPLDFPMVSWHHARLTREAGGILVEDLGSRNGTFVGGIRVSGKVLAKPGEEIGLGSYRFQLLEGGQLAQRTYYGNVTIEAANVVVNAPNGNRLIEPVSMTIFPSELVALMGPAGAGKTTLLKALNGYTKPAQGRVLFNGTSLYDYYDQFRQQLGYVPQDDIVHPQLTVGEALYFSARLRTDLSDDEIRARTVKVLDQLRMLDKKDTLIGSPERKTLSGGQRKRVNIALELINDTPVLFLDEPTSGLSSYDAESVIELLKELSKQGKTIITTIHQPSIHIYKQFDDLIMVNRDPGGKTGSMVYFGPAYPDSIQFLNSLPPGPATTDLSPEMLLSGLAKRTSVEWQQLYQGSRYYQDFVVARPGNQPTPTATGAPGDKPKRHFDLTQWFALVRRNTIVKLRDKTQTAILMIQAPLFATLIVMVYHGLDPKVVTGDDLMKKLVGIHFLMVIAAIWFGCNNAARDIVGEWTVYKRERMVTLRLGSYAFSKLAVLLGLAVVQCLSLLGIVDLSLGLKGNFLLTFCVLVLCALVGTALGLCISAISKTTESAIALLPVVLLPIIALGGGLRPAYLLDAKIRWITLAVPSQWGLEANLLQETGRVKKDGDYKWPLLKDGSTPQAGAAQGQPATMGQPATAGQPAAAGQPPPPAPHYDNAEQECSHDAQVAFAQYTDIADPVIPHARISCPDGDGKMKENFTSKEIVVNYNGTEYKAQRFRHRFRTSIYVLTGMLCTLVIAVLVILRVRDNDPQ